MTSAPPLGLSTYRWNNNLKSVILLAAFPALLVGLVWLFFWLLGLASATPQGFVDPALLADFSFSSLGNNVTPFDLAAEGTLLAAPYALGLAVLWLAVGSLFNENFIQMSTGAKPVLRAENPELYNLLENLCISRGVTMPKLYVIETPAMNAYASGLGQDSFAITVTRGLLNALDKDELEAVLAHELSHILHRDVRLLVVTVLFGGMLSFFAELLWRSMRYSHSGGSRRNGKGVGLAFLIAALLMTVGYFVSLLLRLALSRRREYLADAGAVALTKRPEALIEALRKISGHAAMPDAPSGVQAMMIENPPGIFDLFDTHPPIEKRIDVLRRLGGLPEEGASIIPRTSA